MIYHGDCTDGRSGAWAAWKKFGDRAEYISFQHHDPVPTGLKNKEIYMIDFTFSAEILKKLIKENKRVTSIDHHVSRQKETAMTYQPSYAVNNSGAVLAWKYFHLKKPVPRLLRHVEDMDLWKFKVPRTKEVFLFLDLFDFSFKVWDKLVSDFENPVLRKKYIEQGGLLLRHQNKQVARLVEENAELVEFEGYKTYAVNSAMFASELGHALYERLPPIGIVWRQKPGAKVFSLRSDGSADVAKLAEKYGGGGHKAASGFNLPSDAQLPWIAIKKPEIKKESRN